MKLLLCPVCHDVKKLCSNYRITYCGCKKCWGYYKDDGYHAVMSEEAIPIGFDNDSLANAIIHRTQGGRGVRFEAFVIPRQCDTIKVASQLTK